MPFSDNCKSRSWWLDSNKRVSGKPGAAQATRPVPGSLGRTRTGDVRMQRELTIPALVNTARGQLKAASPPPAEYFYLGVPAIYLKELHRYSIAASCPAIHAASSAPAMASRSSGVASGSSTHWRSSSPPLIRSMARRSTSYS